ncbi:phage tail protein [Pseudomonas juntendi]|uniref:phage tail protein n=1 Tax=Pseudomonas juntendi TaxID=2666183 RepID=UPI0034D5F9C9
MTSLHTDIPPDAVPIDDKRYDEVIKNPPPGKVRGHDEAGLPILIEPPPVVVTFDQLATIERDWRDEQVSSTEWLVSRHRDELDMNSPTTLTAEQFTELLVYRRQLRDWPQSEVFPDSHFRPVRLPWLDLLEKPGSLNIAFD